MTRWQPTRRELVMSAPLLVGAGAFPCPLLASTPPLKFLVIGDWGRRGGAYQRHVARQMGNPAWASDFIVTTGDNFYDFGVLSLTDMHWRQSFEDIYTAPSLQVPWYPVLGNHDYGGSVKAQLDYSSRSHRWRLRDRWYSLSGAHGRQHVDLFFVDTVVWRGEESLPFNLVGTRIGKQDQAAQVRWLVDSLSASKARIKLVFGHHGIYSLGKRAGLDMPQLDDVLREYRVTAYVNGHDHLMYHVSHRGMHYICSGAGSEIIPHYRAGRVHGCVMKGFCHRTGEPDPVFPVWHSFLGRSDNPMYDIRGGFAAFTVYADSVHFQFVDSAGTPRHAARIAV